jgi:hypothetical protein
VFDKTLTGSPMAGAFGFVLEICGWYLLTTGFTLVGLRLIGE